MDELAIALEGGSVANLALTEDGLVVTASGSDSIPPGLRFLRDKQTGKARRFTYLSVLNAVFESAESTVTIKSLLRNDQGQKKATIATVAGRASSSHAGEWTQSLLKRAYGSVKPYRRLKVLLNPFSGKKVAKKAWQTRLEPLFRSAGCIIDYQETTHQSHCTEIAKNIDVSQCDAVVVISGDGLIHEFLNGLAIRDDAVEALKLPITVIPTGSSNALSCCISGPEMSRDIYHAALVAMKGSPLPLDLCVVTQGDKKWISFLATAFGIMADADVGTDSWRWLGPNRMVLGFVRSVLLGKRYPCELWVKNATSDKAEIKQDYFRKRKDSGLRQVDSAKSLDVIHGDNNEPLEQSTSWTRVVENELTMLYAGTLPYVDPGLMAFPTANKDGKIDLYLIKTAKRLEMLKFVDGAERGLHFDFPPAQYFKCDAYRLVPKTRKDWLAIDGEVVPCETIQVECKPGLARCLGLETSFFAPPEWQVR